MNGVSPLIIVHIIAATIGLLSGYLSILVRKGSGLHRAAGQVFFVSMLIMSASAAYYAAFVHAIRINVIGGLLTFYLVCTGWWAGRRRNGTSAFDRIGLAVAIGVAAIAWTASFQALFAPGRAKDGVVAPAYIIFGIGALFAVRSDIRLLRSGGVNGAARIARHLYRMGFALLIAVFSFFPGQGKIFPESWRQSGLLLLPHVLLIGTMLVWRRRLRRGGNASAAHLVAQPHDVARPLLDRQQLQTAGGHAAILDVEQ